MAEQISFTTRVRNVVAICSKDYKDFFVDYDYLICSKAFIHRPYYIVVADKIVFGDFDSLKEYHNLIKDMLSDNLLSTFEERDKQENLL